MKINNQYFRENEKIEIWGGIECTINRVDDTYYDQLEFSGHYLRNTDIELFAGLGIKALRYPIIWEKHCSVECAPINWDHAAQNLNKLRELGITPIVGLVHHGSGPGHTNLLDPSFVSGLAEFAKQVAEKFPWVEYYTPVNEPLTTARFCGLYGYWHPHGKSDLEFTRILLNECKATTLAMQAIREINHNAKLVQTEDLGKVYSTPVMKYQADFENERRWLSFDLLCGKIAKGYRMWDHLKWLGITDEEIDFFSENPCPPDIMGVNYYITSERFLDEHIENYPANTIGGNGRHQYADVEAVRAAIPDATGPRILINELWERYKLPVAITEVQLSCTREEQLRWIKYIWDSAQELKSDGVDIRAITSWSLLGAFGWNHLLRESHHEYETGVFDVRSGIPRATALADLLKSLSSDAPTSFPFLENEGWWKKPSRFLYFPYGKKEENATSNLIIPSEIKKEIRPVLVIGKNGTLGKAFSRICDDRNLNHELLSRQDMDICSIESIEKVLLDKKPWAIVNAAGYVRVDDAETDAGKCFLDNTSGPLNLALACKKYGIKLLTFSSDLVFDGKKASPYLESDLTSPLNVYGQSKAMAERQILGTYPEALVIRTSAFFGPWDQFNFVSITLNSLSSQQAVTAMSNSLVSPTYIPDLANASMDLLIDNAQGIWHIANNGEVTWADFALEIAKRANFNRHLITSAPLEALNLPALRPTYSVLKSEKGIVLPSLDNALDRYFFDIRQLPGNCLI